MKKITITELAKVAGVSTASVRRFLKNEKVRSDIEEKMKKAVEETGYVMEEQTSATEASVETLDKTSEEAIVNDEVKNKEATKKKDVREEFSKKFKGAVKRTGVLLDDTKSKLANSTKNIKKNVANADITGKVKGSFEKTGTKLSEAKDKVIKKDTMEDSVTIDHQTAMNSLLQVDKDEPIVKAKKPIIRERKGYTFAILTKDVTNPRSRKMIKAIQTVCHESDCMLSIYVGEGNAPLEEKYVNAILQQQVDAMIVEGVANSAGLLKQLKSANIPSVFLNEKGNHLVSLAVDEEQAGVVLGTYLMKMRHLIVRYLGADEALSTAHYEGIKKIYHDKKQPLDFTTKMCDGTYLDIYEKMKEIFEEKIDVLLLERDEMAIPLSKYLKEYHIAVPQNASVMSFGGHAITKVMSPTLASLAFDYNEYAEYVCSSIFAILEGKTKPKMPEIYHIQEGDSVR